MNKKDLAAQIAARENKTFAEADRMIDAVLNGIADALASGNSVKIIGFGTFETKERAAHTGRNPHDPSQKFEIPAHRSVKFRAGKNLKELIEG